jgi:cytochrome c peroxidase
VLVGCGGAGGSAAAGSASTARSAIAQLGERIFFDTSLSASGTLSCANCHTPARAHAAPTPVGADGEPRKFDDLPPEYAGNVNVTEAPYDRLRGGSPALTDAEIADVISFLDTLTDGYQL